MIKDYHDFRYNLKEIKTSLFAKYNNETNIKILAYFLTKELYKAIKFISKSLFITFIVLVFVYNLDVNHQQIKKDIKGNETVILTDTYSLIEVFTPLEAVYNYFMER